jgi:sialate O-acetylesterase
LFFPILRCVFFLPGGGRAATIDAGEENNVHARNKRTVGLRLARWAFGEVYGGDEVRSGPLFESAAVEDASVRVHFTGTGGGLKALDGKPLRGFAIAGSDRRFFWAEAKVDGDSIVVGSAKVPAPVAVRYGWAGNPVCNLGNKEGLPASPFRTDDWPGLTAASR